VTAAGYKFCLFDGVSRFYVAEEQAERLGSNLSYPACALDDFVDARVADLQAELRESEATILRWRHAALGSWASGVARTQLATNHASLVAGLNTELSRTQKQLRKTRRRLAQSRRRLRLARERLASTQPDPGHRFRRPRWAR
jgi:hypothetical protein